MSEAQRLPQYIAALVAAGGAFGAGTILGWTNPVEKKITDGYYGFDVNDDQFSWIGSSLPLGAAVACIPSGFLIDGIGRQLTLILLVIPFGIGWGLICVAKNVWMLYLGRAVLGVACGTTCVAAPMYTGEIAQKEVRGTLGSFFQLLITLGILFVYLMGMFSNPIMLSLICAAIPLVVALVMIAMPESPAYLVRKGKDEKAAKSVAWLRGKNYDGKGELDSFKVGKDETTSFFEGFKKRACVKALGLSLGLMFFQQFSGINAVIFYSTTIFENAGSSLKPQISTVIIGVVQVIATMLAVVFVDKLGRRLLLLISAAVMALSTFVMGIYFFMQSRNEDSVKDLGWLPVIALCVFIVMFSFGFGPVPWLMVGELFPADVKGPAGSIAGTSNWLWAFVVSKAYVNVKNAIGTGVTFWIFSVITILGFVFVLLLLPETKGKSLSEIQEILAKDDK